MKYKLEGSDVPWTDEQYKKFLEGLEVYFNVPTNNRKIAQMMGKNIEPNHVKHVKSIYMRNMNARIDNGEIGGGKKGTFQSRVEFLKKDIQNFNLRWFKKDKNKTKKIKKRRRRDLLDEDQEDPDYWVYLFLSIIILYYLSNQIYENSKIILIFLYFLFSIFNVSVSWPQNRTPGWVWKC